MWEPHPRSVERARRGDIRAFEEIVRGLLPEVMRLARHLVRDDHLAEDISQEVFLKAFKALPGFKGDSRFSTWVLRITRNAAIDAVRRRRREQRLIQESGSTRNVPDPSIKNALYAALADLPQDLREAFVVIEVFGLPYAEAAVVLSTKPGTLKSRMHRARKSLVAYLSELEDTSEV